MTAAIIGTSIASDDRPDRDFVGCVDSLFALDLRRSDVTHRSANAPVRQAVPDYGHPEVAERDEWSSTGQVCEGRLELGGNLG